MTKLISWIEIPAINFNKAVDFYSKLLNLKLEVFDFGEEKMACFPGGEGAISQAPGFKPSGNGVLVSFNSGGDINSTLKIAEQNGGKIVTPKTKIQAEDRGYFAVIIDCEGNKIGLYEDLM